MFTYGIFQILGSKETMHVVDRHSRFYGDFIFMFWFFNLNCLNACLSVILLPTNKTNKTKLFPQHTCEHPKTEVTLLELIMAATITIQMNP